MLSGRMFARNSYMAMAIAAGALLLGTSAGAAQAQMSDHAREGAQAIAAGTTTAYQTLYVNPTSGSDRAEGVADQPLRTVTRALELAAPNTVIVLAPGRYTQASGEVFPLQLKSGVTIQGAPGMRNRDAVIEGGGSFESPTRSRQNAAIVAADRAGIAQVAISNPDGYGVWVESASPTILESAFVGNLQTGIYVAGGSPRVQGSYFSGNRVAGLIVFGVSSANIQGNTFEKTGDAIRIMDGATPEIIDNRITDNEAGLVVIGDSHPVLRDNKIEGNRQNNVVEIASRAEDIDSATASTADEAAAEQSTVSPQSLQPVAQPTASQLLVDQPTAAEPTTTEPTAAEPTAAEPTAAEPAESQLAKGGDSSGNSANNYPAAGAPGSALATLRSGITSEVLLASRASDSSAIRPRVLRSQPESEPESESLPEPISEPSVNPAPSVNRNRLAVPGSSIPLGSGASAVFSPPQGGGGGGVSSLYQGGMGSPPAPSSRAQALGLYYRVFAEASDPLSQDEVKEIVPDAFRTQFEGRTVMQVGAFPTEDEAKDRQQLLKDHNIDVRVEYIP